MSTASFQNFMIARRRGVLLGALAECAPGVAVAADLLQKYCLSINLRTTVDEIESDLAWLGERALLQLGRAGSLVTAVITRPGRDVVARLVQVPGVDIADSSGL